jgi:hypothetical protein
MIVVASSVIVGGVKRIGRFCEKLVPLMALWYVIGGVIMAIPSPAGGKMNRRKRFRLAVLARPRMDDAAQSQDHAQVCCGGDGFSVPVIWFDMIGCPYQVFSRLQSAHESRVDFGKLDIVVDSEFLYRREDVGSCREPYNKLSPSFAFDFMVLIGPLCVLFPRLGYRVVLLRFANFQ